MKNNEVRLKEKFCMRIRHLISDSLKKKQRVQRLSVFLV